MSRSAAIVIAYLIYTQNMSYDSAFDLVRRKRACIKPNSGFVRCAPSLSLTCPTTDQCTGRSRSGRRSGATSAQTPARPCAEPPPRPASPSSPSPRAVSPASCAGAPPALYATSQGNRLPGLPQPVLRPRTHVSSIHPAAPAPMPRRPARGNVANIRVCYARTAPGPRAARLARPLCSAALCCLLYHICAWYTRVQPILLLSAFRAR